MGVSPRECVRGSGSSCRALKLGGEVRPVWHLSASADGRVRKDVSEGRVSAKIWAARRRPPCQGGEGEHSGQKGHLVRNVRCGQERSWHIPGSRPRPAEPERKGSGGGAEKARPRWENWGELRAGWTLAVRVEAGNCHDLTSVLSGCREEARP